MAFIEGDYMCYQHAHLEIPKLLAGEYILFLKADWTALNPVKRLVMNIYAPDPFEIQRINVSKFPLPFFSAMNEWLNRRLLMGHSYEIPVMSADQDVFDIEELESIQGVSITMESSYQNEQIFMNYSISNIKDENIK